MFFVFDVETIPDFEFVRGIIQDPHEDDDELLLQAGEELARNQSGFLPPMYHKMISWVGLWIENNGVPKRKVSWNGTDEKKDWKKSSIHFRRIKISGLSITMDADLICRC
ncbi:MAG: hypothetical protein U5K69_17455 [Balneolaceae bacterium]|nr:hypothetical protein [Balneolaceae bacterium]